MSERGQAAHMLEARERRQAHRLHSDPLAKSHHSSLTCAFVSQVYPSFNPPPTICAFCHVSVVQMGKTVDIYFLTCPLPVASDVSSQKFNYPLTMMISGVFRFLFVLVFRPPV